MSLQDALDAALKAVPDCNIVSYIDIDSGLVLRKAVASPVAQEILDRCATVAGAIWKGNALFAAAESLSGQDAETGPVFVLKGPRHTYVFARSPKYDDHAICFRCGVDSRPEPLAAAVGSALGLIADGY